MNNLIVEGEGFGSVDYVHQCLIDKDKALAFETAIKEVMRSSYQVLEVGTGTGILSLIACRAGAKKVTAIEFDPVIADIARENIKQNGYEDTVTILTADARNITFPDNQKFDVVIMEMLCTGLIEEMQVQAINNLISQDIICPPPQHCNSGCTGKLYRSCSDRFF